jgi:thiol-disulfide isomerase/thioredoxin
MNRAALLTLGVMVFIVALGALYIFFLDESERQKNNQTPAAVALLVENESESFTDKDGNKVAFEEDFGKIMVVSSWASWCPQCGEDLKRLDEVAKEFEGREVVFLAINRGEDKYSAERYLATIEQPQTLRIILDPTDHFFVKNEGYAMPETVVYDEHGQILQHQRGDLNQDDLRNTLKNNLE